MKKLSLSAFTLFLSIFVFSSVAIAERSPLPPLHEEVIGAWKLVKINDILPYHQAYLYITAENMFARTGCNHLFSTITWFDQDFWEIDPVSTTRMDCAGTRELQELLILNTLKSGANISYQDDEKQLIIQESENVLTYNKISESN
ncbi:heat shock protein [Shewanella psychrophila]|uniref:Heat shock protein n=1 Tax=Shewanella psychrophila TaxID=225848 RepID=A0A1S6HST2_9GAMM|nr:META domain-containing protein [Shewanella psychrophila]AQS38544.1 heat shock protein [Shewanella psychrophila]